MYKKEEALAVANDLVAHLRCDDYDNEVSEVTDNEPENPEGCMLFRFTDSEGRSFEVAVTPG